jgi:hypothetical protein
MKKHILIASLAAASTLFTACNEQYNTTNITNQQEASAEAYYAPTFAEPDDAKRLTGTPAENLRAIFEATGPEIITSMGNMNITNEQYEEIAAFTTKLVEGKKTQKEKFNVIHNWVNGNVKYDPSDNDPYAVFTNKTGVCQGYANLLTVMCYSQDIPTVVVNGYLNQPPFYGAHAWNYVCADGKWYVGALTDWNSRNVTISFPFMKQGSKYSVKVLADTKESDKTPSVYEITETVLEAGAEMTLNLAQGGGAAMIIEEI